MGKTGTNMPYKNFDAGIRNSGPESPRFPGAVSAVMILALGLGGCGDGGSEPSASGPATTPPTSLPVPPKVSAETKPETGAAVSHAVTAESRAPARPVADSTADLAIPEGQLKAGQVLSIEIHHKLTPTDLNAAANAGEVRIPKLLLDARIVRVPLRQALAALGDKLGAKVSVAPTLADSEVTVEFAALPVEEGIKRILADRNFMVIHGKPASPDHPKAGRGTAGKVAAAAEGRIAEIRVLDKNGEAEHPEELTGSSGDAKTREIERLAMKAVNGTTAEVRLGALEKYLEKAPTKEILGTVLQTMKDSDPKVRQKALGSFAMAVQDPDDRQSLNAVADVAIHDADPSTRTSAVYAMLTAYGAQAAPMLEQALNDPDPGVQAAARESLDTLSAMARR